jgi:hypothetical protein
MNPKILPTVMLVLQVLSAIPYACQGNWRMAGYWLAAGVLTICVTF